jgi:uncharacterized membrane protein
MNLTPLLDAGPVIATHALAAIAALALGPFVILRQRRGRLHRWAGYVWVGAMALTALSALAIHEVRLIGPFSPIHLLIGLVVVNLWRAIAAARAGRMVEHGRTMAQLYIMALAVAGAFTLLPGRRMNAVLFGGDSWAGFALGATVLALVSVALWRAQPRPRPPVQNPLSFGRTLG